MYATGTDGPQLVLSSIPIVGQVKVLDHSLHLDSCTVSMAFDPMGTSDCHDMQCVTYLVKVSSD